jgi:WhiB family redox-sensing transcriptional regulator
MPAFSSLSDVLASLPWSRPEPEIEALLLPDWTLSAACRDLDEAAADRIFFPERGGRATAAGAICHSCVVRGECLEYALSDENAFDAGIWGGTTPKERRALAAPPAPPPSTAHLPNDAVRGRIGGL